MTSFWTWLSIIGLSMTPNLILGPSAAVGVGIAAHYDPSVLLPVVAVAGYLEGLVVAWLAGESTQIGFIGRWVARMRTPRSTALADRWGVWGGLTIGCAVVGQEPILVALRCAGWASTCAGSGCRWHSATRSSRSSTTRSYYSASTRSHTSDVTLHYQ